MNAESGKTFSTINPVTGEVIVDVQEGDKVSPFYFVLLCLKRRDCMSCETPDTRIRPPATLMYMQPERHTYFGAMPNLYHLRAKLKLHASWMEL